MEAWRLKQKENFTSIEKLISFLELSEEDKALILKEPRFILNLPLRLAEKMEKKRIDDPLFLQFVPLQEESKERQGFVSDPVLDLSFCKTKKMLHKYEHRALLLVSSACAMHCRYCFRQNFPYETKEKLFEEELEAIRQETSLKEIILSGGDPLSLSSQSLQFLFDEIEKIPHIKRLRLHTRFPVGIPERIDDKFLSLLDARRFQIFFVIHINHKNELGPDLFDALAKIQKRGIPILHQAVLLKGVNDSFEALHKLLEELVDHGIIPYYLHQLDKVVGTHHFEVEKEKGLALLDELKKTMSGYAIPRYVEEIPGDASKRAILHPI